MALDAKRKNLDGLDEKESQHYIKDETTGEYKLNVTKVNGLGLEDVSGLKSTVEKLRASEKTLQTEVKTTEDALKTAQADHKEFVTKFTGIDPEAAKEALSKIEDIKNWDGETKVREAVQVAEQKIEAKMQAKLDEVVNQHTTKTEELESNLADSQSQLQEAVVTSKIIEAISKEKGNVDVLMPHVRNQVVMIKDPHGTWKPEVQSKEGNPRVNSNGADLTITQLVQEMKTQDTFAACFPGAGSTGSGTSGSSDTGSHQNAGDGKTIKASDGKAISENLEDIASGKVKVDINQ